MKCRLGFESVNQIGTLTDCFVVRHPEASSDTSSFLEKIEQVEALLNGHPNVVHFGRVRKDENNI